MTRKPPPAPTLVLLAAGLGTRFGGDKQLARVGPAGETLMDYTVFDAARAGFGAVVFVVREAMEPAFGREAHARYGARLRVACAVQRLEDVPPGAMVPAGRTAPWGTGQAVLAAEAHLRGPFAVANADDFYGAAALEAAATFLRAPHSGAPPTFAVVAYPVRDTLSPAGTVNRAVCETTGDGWLAALDEVRAIRETEDGRITGRGSRGEVVLAATAPVSMNLWAFTPAVFPLLHEAFARHLAGPEHATAEFLLPDAVSAWISVGAARVRVLPAAGRWFGLTHADDRAGVEAALRERVARGEYPVPLWHA